MSRASYDIQDLLIQKEIQNICAPMVRYSKLEFRSLVRKYGCQLCFSPMIVADSFVQSIKARHNEFTTTTDDTPLVVQFASNNVSDLVESTKLISPYCDGVDINCGCPQSWAIGKGYGCSLLSKPHLVKDMVLQVRNSVPSSFSVSVKIRIHQDIRKTVELCRCVEAAGASFVTVHGRTPKQRREPVDTDAVRTLTDSLRVPVVANGDVRNLDQLSEMQSRTNCHGIMVARGLLSNPGMFAGFSQTPESCVRDWLDICSVSESSLHFMTFHHHLVFMMEKMMTRKQKTIFNNLKRCEEVVAFLDEEFGLRKNLEREATHFNLSDICYPDSETQGSYFRSFTGNENQADRRYEDYLEDSCLPY